MTAASADRAARTHRGDGGSRHLALAALAALLPLAAGGEPEAPAAAALRVSECDELRVCYRSHEWTPERLDRAEDRAFSPVQAWPLATMEVLTPLGLDGVELAPGAYAWVCAPDHHGQPKVELRRLRLPEGALPDPETVEWVTGEPVWEAPIRFDTSLGLAPRLTISLTPRKGGVRLEVRYGEGRVVRELERR